MAKIQKNPMRLAFQIRQQPDEDLWRKWAHDMRTELALHYVMNNMLPVQGSRLKVVDKHRRMFDSHGSNPQEAIETPDNHPTYWKALAAHKGGSNAKPCEYSVWDAFETIREKYGFDVHSETYEIWEPRYANIIR